MAADGGFAFREQISFFLRKYPMLTQAWTDVWQDEHNAQFMVAGASKAELLQDFQDAVKRIIVDGSTRAEFLREFDDIVARHGWSYNGGREWRARIIYETNLRMSYAAGRWAQLKASTAAFPYWRYRHSNLDKVPRPLHITPYPAGFNGLILPHDDPWWLIFFPPNGWGCTCYVEGISLFELERLGRTGPDTAPAINWTTRTVGVNGPHPRTVRVPEGVDPGFAYAPGANVTAEVKQAVDEIREYELDTNLAAALARWLANLPPPPPTPYIDVSAAGAGAARSGTPPQQQGSR